MLRDIRSRHTTSIQAPNTGINQARSLQGMPSRETNNRTRATGGTSSPNARKNQAQVARRQGVAGIK
jgi:hypothetical protein